MRMILSHFYVLTNFLVCYQHKLDGTHPIVVLKVLFSLRCDPQVDTPTNPVMYYTGARI